MFRRTKLQLPRHASLLRRPKKAPPPTASASSPSALGTSGGVTSPVLDGGTSPVAALLLGPGLSFPLLHQRVGLCLDGHPASVS